MSKTKVWEKKSFLLILLGFLCVVIVGLGVGTIMTLHSNTSIDIIMSEIEETYDGELLSTNGALVFYNFMIEKKDSGDLNNEDIYNYYEGILNKVSGETKLSYLIYYARFFFDNEMDLEGAADILKRFKLELVDSSNDLKIDYYAGLRNLYLKGGDIDQAENCGRILEELSTGDSLSPDGVYIKEEEPTIIVNG